MNQKSSATMNASVFRRPLILMLVLVLILIMVITLVGCDPIDTTAATTSTRTTATATQTTTTSPTTTAATTTTPTTTQPTTTAPTTTAESTTPETTAVSETRMGYIVSVSSSGTETITIDYIEMYFGDEAVVKALEDNSDVVETDENGDYFIPNDFYIRNNNPRLRTFPMAPGYAIMMLPASGGPDATDSVTFARLRSLVQEYKRLTEIRVVLGNVVTIEEIYIP